MRDRRAGGAGRSGFYRDDRFADGGAEVGPDGASVAGRERAGRPRVLPEVFRRPRIPARLRALGRERRPGRCVRELQPLARTARAWRRRRDRPDVPEGQRRDAQAVPEAKTTKAVPAGVDGMYFKEFSALSDWQHHGEGLQLFNRMALSVPADPKYLERVRRFAGLLHG